MTKFLGILAIVTSITSAAFAATNCAEVVSDLREMQKAQQSISQSLINNHETFATLLEEYSGTLNSSAAMGQPVTKEAVTHMNESAKAFRVRGQNAQKLNQKLNQASDQVIARAIECLKAKRN